jgi:hypothetical protein
MKAENYLESIGLRNVIDEEFFNDDDKSWYKVQELMESYHQAKLDLLTIPVVVGTLCECKEYDALKYNEDMMLVCGKCEKPLLAC